MTFNAEYLIEIIRLTRAKFGHGNIGAVILNRQQAIELGRHMDEGFIGDRIVRLELDGLAEKYARKVEAIGVLRIYGLTIKDVAPFSSAEGVRLLIKDWERSPVFIIKGQGMMEWEEATDAKDI